LQGLDGIRDTGCLVVGSDQRNDPRLRTAASARDAHRRIATSFNRHLTA
jgi:hypothetical protein